MSNFMIQGGIVSFTFQDQAMKTGGGQPRQAEPEDIIDVVMREQDFEQLLKLFNPHHAAYQKQIGKRAGADKRPGSMADPGPRSTPAGREAAEASPAGGAFKIRPKGY